jgi:antitoxin (DNA-binding transcriptional repressor) of toxin-antitoxin stability system
VTMKTLSVAKLKAQFSSVVVDLRNGEEVAITYGRNKQPLATIIPQSKLAQPNHAIPLGDLQKKGWSYAMRDFEMSDEELLST